MQMLVIVKLCLYIYKRLSMLDLRVIVSLQTSSQAGVIKRRSRILEVMKRENLGTF